MFRISRFVTILIVVSLAISTVPIGAVAQENTTSPSPTNETDANETEVDDDLVSGESAENGSYVQEIDPTLRLVAWEYDGSAFVLTLESDRSTSLTATEAVQFEEGSGTMTIERHNVPRGTTNITVNVPPRNGEAGLVLTTSTSVNNGKGTFVSTGQTNSASPFERTSSTAGWIGGAGTVMLMFVTVAWREVRREPDAPEVAE